MKLTVTGVPEECAGGLTVAKLIELEQIETPGYTTVSVNDEFTHSDMFAEIVLEGGDSMKFLYFMGGGAI